MFALVKVGFLFADMNDDPGRAGSAVVIPKADFRGARKGTLWKSLATANDQRDQACACNAEETARVHEGDIYPRLVRLLQLKLCGPICQGVALVLATQRRRLTLCVCPNTLCLMQTVQPPIDLENWIEENREKFKPPVSNRYLYDGRDFFVMVIKGPNARNDFHLVDSEEYFYQLKGDIKVRVREGDRIVDHIVKEGETFFIPPNVPHSPQRPPDTIGVVVERRRPPGEKEHVIFYCENCGSLVEDIHFDCADIVEHFSQAMLDFWNDDKRRTCKKCGKKVEKALPMESL
jgi:3-hydroxyanthranilate 3,4-dioxygenase